MTTPRLVLSLPLPLALLALLGACLSSVPLSDAPAVEPALALAEAEPEPELGDADANAAATDAAADEARFVPRALPAAETRARGLELLRQGNALSRARQFARARERYAEAEALLPHFEGWARVLAADAARLAGDTAGVRRLLDGLPADAAAEWGWRIRVHALREANDLRAALDAAEEAARSLPAGPGAANAWAEAGVLAARLSEPGRATFAYRSAMMLAPETPGALQAARGALELPGLTPDDRLRIGRTLLRHGGLDRGIASLEAYLASGHGTTVERAAVSEEAGRALFTARRFAAAVPHLQTAANVSADAAYLLGRALYRSGRTEAGIETLRATARRFSNEPAAADALFTLGDLAHDAGRTGAAREHFRGAVATGVHTQAAADAAARLAMLALREGNPRLALADLERYLASRPADAISTPVLYWAGRVQTAAGHEPLAEQLYRQALRADPFSYYGMRAAERLNQRPTLHHLTELPRAAPRVEGEVEEAFFRIDLLRDLELRDEAAFELARLRFALKENPAALVSVAEGMAPRGQPIAAALLAREAQQAFGTWDERLLRLVFQFPYRELVTREARRQGLDPYLVAGLIRQESFFNPVAVSRAGAIGLMQVMPATGRGLARRAGVARYSPELLRQPEINVRMGTLFLADQVRRWQRESEAFAAYNAGPGRVVRWRTFPEHADDDLFIERIPFLETRDYVKKVRLYAQIYRALYGES